MKLLDWDILKSRDSKRHYPRLNVEIELWGNKRHDHSDGSYSYEPMIKSLPLEECPENACRCLHFGAVWNEETGLQCNDCEQKIFFGTFDVLRWIIREFRLKRENPKTFHLESVIRDLNKIDYEVDFDWLVQIAEHEANTCRECFGQDPFTQVVIFVMQKQMALISRIQNAIRTMRLASVVPAANDA